MAKNSLNEQINMSGINQNIHKEVLVQFLASAGVGVIEWWITTLYALSREGYGRRILATSRALSDMIIFMP